MVRRKKSLLFSVSLASAGLVAGALFAASPRSQAAEDVYGAAVGDATIQSISKDTGISAAVIKDSFNTKTLIVGVNDEGELKNNSDIVSYEKVAESVYAVTFKDYEATFRNYVYFNENDKGSSAELNIPLEIMGKTEAIPTSFSEKIGYPEYDKCFSVDSSTFTYNNFTGIPDQCLSWGASSMNLTDYAKTITSAKTVKVAVIDTGIHASHYAFSYSSENAQDRLDMTLAYDYYGSGRSYSTGQYRGDNNPDDGGNANGEDGHRITHGTSVAGAITESTPYNVKVVPIRIANGATLDMALALKAISGIKGKVDVINLSLGSKVKFAPGDNGYSLYDRVLKEAKDAGSIIVAASGNSGQNFVSWPASSEYTIAVGATNENNSITDFSQYGSQIDFAAPGDILLLPMGEQNTAMGLTSGTSFSAPLISAAVATIISEHPNYSYSQIYKTLKLNAEDIGAAGKDNKSGWGSVSFRINRFADLKLTASTASTWTNGKVNIAASATSAAHNINKYAIVSGSATDVAPSSWKTVSSPAKTVSISKDVSENGAYTIWFKNANNEVSAKTVTVNTIDKVVPFISKGFAVTEISEEAAALSISIKDTASGLSKIVWHYKAEEDEEYTDKTEVYNESGTGETSVTEKTIALADLEAGNTYMAYATIFDMAGNSRDSAIATFKAEANGAPVYTEGDKEEPTTPAKLVNSTKVKTANPNTSDNMPAIASLGGTFIAVALLVFRQKRR